MRKNIALVSLFIFFAFSLFLNLAAFGERIRLNGTIEELNQVLVYDLEYAKAVDNVREELAQYAWYADTMIDAKLNNDQNTFNQNLFFKMSAVYKINEATISAKMVKNTRSEYIRNTKYVGQIKSIE